MTAVRAAAKRLDYELPPWVDISSGIGGLALVAIGLLALFRSFLVLIGAPLPADSPWPGTLVYSAVCIALIFAAGYLPARIPSFASSHKTEWEPPLAESFFLYFASFESGRSSTFKVKIVASKEGTKIARLLGQILRHYHWTLEVNADDGTYVFPTTSPVHGTRIRYRESQEGIIPDVFGVVSALAGIPQTEYFPEDDQFNFAQIEIGAIPEFYSGPPQFMNSG